MDVFPALVQVQEISSTGATGLHICQMTLTNDLLPNTWCWKNIARTQRPIPEICQAVRGEQ